MGCGSGRLRRLVSGLGPTLGGGCGVPPVPAWDPAVERHGQRRPVDFDEQVRILYARGEIDRETYYRLRGLEPSASGAEGPEAAPAELLRVRSRLRDLDRVRADTEQVIADIGEKRRELATQAGLLEQQARAAVARGDDDGARALLQQRQALMQQDQDLQERADSLRGDLEQVHLLRQQLEARALEFRAAESARRLAQFALDIRPRPLAES